VKNIDEMDFHKICQGGSLFSSPELKAQVSYSGHPSVCKLLHFRRLVQNHWVNFNQTWHKSSLGRGNIDYIYSETSQNWPALRKKKMAILEGWPVL
jgi:hypothetical protein